MPERSKTHHFVPQMVFVGFAQKRQVMTVDLTTKRSFLQNIANAGAENDWNTLRLEGGAVSDVAERAISELMEGPAAGVLQRIRAGEWIESEEERVALARLIAFQMVRVPGHREQTNAIADLLLKMEVASGGLEQLREMMVATTGGAATENEVRAQWAALADYDSWSVELPREHHVLQSLEQVDRFAGILVHAYSWAVIRWRHGSLLTSDAPLLLIPAPGASRFHGVGIGTAGSVYLAIGRRCALALHNKAVFGIDDGFERDPTAQVARSLNRGAVVFSRRWIYHHPNDTLSRLLGEDFDLPTPKPITYRTGNNAKILNALTKSAEWHAEHPDKPHPLSRLPLLPDPPPGARPPRLS